MKDTQRKDKRRVAEYQKKSDYYECWSISERYSGDLIQQIDSSDLYNICKSVTGQYMNELSGKNLETIDKNYTQVWTTMMNTVKKGGDTRLAIKLLYQTSCQRSV
jgi:hypothetical protein